MPRNSLPSSRSRGVKRAKHRHYRRSHGPTRESPTRRHHHRILHSRFDGDPIGTEIDRCAYRQDPVHGRRSIRHRQHPDSAQGAHHRLERHPEAGVLGDSQITDAKIEHFIHAQPGIETDPQALSRVLNWARSQFVYEREQSKAAMTTAPDNNGMLPLNWTAQYLYDHDFAPIYTPGIGPNAGEMQQPDGRSPGRQPAGPYQPRPDQMAINWNCATASGCRNERQHVRTRIPTFRRCRPATRSIRGLPPTRPPSKRRSPRCHPATRWIRIRHRHLRTHGAGWPKTRRPRWRRTFRPA